MALSASEVYCLSAAELRKECYERGLDSCGPVRLLRERLSVNIRSNTMRKQSDADMEQASSKVSLGNDNELNCPPHLGVLCSHGPCGNGQGQVLAELSYRVPRLSSEEPTEILYFLVRLQEIHNLQLVGDSAFIIQILPL
jgi:hypothetical protein